MHRTPLVIALLILGSIPAPAVDSQEWEGLYRHASALVGSGNFKEAEPLVLQAITLATQLPPVCLGKSMMAKGKIALALHGDREALEALTAAVPNLEKGAESDPQPLAEALNLIGEIHCRLKQHLEALPLLERVLALGEQAPDKLRLECLFARNTLSAVYFELKQPDRAERSLLEGLKIIMSLPDPPNLEWIMQVRLGAISVERKEWAHARTRFRRALDLIRQTQPDRATDMVALLSDLGNIEMETGRFREAETLFRQAYELCLNHHGSESEEALTILHFLEKAARRHGHFAHAAMYSRWAVHAVEAREDPNPLLVAHWLWKEGQADLQGGKPGLAEPVLLRALKLGLTYLKEPREMLLDQLQAMQGVHLTGRGVVQLKGLWIAYLEGEQKRLGPEEPHVAACLEGLGDFYLDWNEPGRALPPLQRALAIREKQPDSPALIGVLTRLGRQARKSGDLARAKQTYAQALAVGERVHGDHHPDLGPLMQNLAWVCRALKQEDEADRLEERFQNLHYDWPWSAR